MLSATSCTVADGTEPTFIDVMKKGEQLSAADVVQRFPGTDVVSSYLATAARRQTLPPDGLVVRSLWWQPALKAMLLVLAGQVELLEDPRPLQIWAELVRTVIVALQRRGESDGVANFLYQLLALDTAAAEWQQVLKLT